MKKTLAVSVTMIGVLFLLTSCRDEPTAPPDVARTIVRAKKQRIKTIKAAPKKTKYIQRKDVKEIKPPVSTYNVSRRDPFKPFLRKEQQIVDVKDVKPKTPLQEYNINELKLVGVILGMGRPTAMVEDPAGKGYVIKKGTLIGDRNGKVVTISKDKVIVIERFRDLLGDMQKSEVVLEIPKSEGEEFP
ncbi:MAG: pilus assembly protein PilP [Thermodesulfobacteriota bacterium]